jgi:hypothetical protein
MGLDTKIDWLAVSRSVTLTLTETSDVSSRWGEVNAVLVKTIVAAEAREQDSELGLGSQKKTRGQPVKN